MSTHPLKPGFNPPRGDRRGESTDPDRTRPPISVSIRPAAIDATGLHALEEFHHKCRRQGTTLVLSGVHAQPLNAIVRAGLDRVFGLENMFSHIDGALGRARQLVGVEAAPPP